jgi:glycosyltransferase involved in cell wall biosynthesis
VWTIAFKRKTGMRREPPAQVKLVIVNTEALSWHFWKGQGAYMRARGIEYHCISSGGPLLDQFGKREGVFVHEVEVTRTITPWRDFRSILRLAAKFREIRPQIVQGDTSKSGLLAMIAGWLARVPVRVYRNHGMALSSAHGVRRVLLWWCEKISCLLADEVVYVAPSVREAAIQEGVCPPCKARVLLSANGLDVEGRFNPANLEPGIGNKIKERYGIPTGALVLGFIGRLFRVKGIVELVQAWETLAKTYPNLHLLAAGEFDTRDPVPVSVEERLRSDTRIHLPGYVDDTPPLYAAMDVLILPSFHEGLGYALIEASAMEVPVVGTRIPGIVDAIRDGLTGSLIEPGSVAAIVDSVRRYLDDPALRKRHGKAGRRYVVETFRQERVWGELHSYYENLSRLKCRPAPKLAITAPATVTQPMDAQFK